MIRSVKARLLSESFDTIKIAMEDTDSCTIKHTHHVPDTVASMSIYSTIDANSKVLKLVMAVNRPYQIWASNNIFPSLSLYITMSPIYFIKKKRTILGKHLISNASQYMR